MDTIIANCFDNIHHAVFGYDHFNVIYAMNNRRLTKKNFKNEKEKREKKKEKNKNPARYQIMPVLCRVYRLPETNIPRYLYSVYVK